MKRTPKAPIVHKLEQWRTWRPDYRDDGLDLMVLWLAAAVVSGIAAFVKWGGA